MQRPVSKNKHMQNVFMFWNNYFTSTVNMASAVVAGQSVNTNKSRSARMSSAKSHPEIRDSLSFQIVNIIHPSGMKFSPHSHVT